MNFFERIKTRICFGIGTLFIVAIVSAVVATFIVKVEGTSARDIRFDNYDLIDQLQDTRKTNQTLLSENGVLTTQVGILTDTLSGLQNELHSRNEVR